jgi:chromosomal replication initiator protein
MMVQLDWNIAINSIKEAVAPTQFQNWFKNLTLVRCDERSVVLGVPSRFHGDWLRSHYSEHLKTAIKRQVGNEVQLEFEILVGEVNKEASESQPIEPIAPEAAPQRPVLRVLEGGGTNSQLMNATGIPENFPSSPSEDPSPQGPEAPNYPIPSQPLIVLEFNRMAHQCIQMFTERHATINPVIFQADTGMGKTLLLSEIGMTMHARNPSLRIRYTNAENFTAEMVQALKGDTIFAFKKKYREETDVLLFDDIQGLTKRTRSQEELLYIYNEILNRGGRVAFTTSVAPHRLEAFIDPLKSRLQSAVVAEVKNISYDDRVMLLAKMCQQQKMTVSGEVLRALAAKSQKDVRELAGTLLRVHLQAKLQNKTLDNQFLSQSGWVQEVKRESISMDEIISMIESNFGVSKTELTSKSRKSLTTWARQVAMFLARNYTLLSLEEIGKAFGRDHATVIHAFQKVSDAMQSHPTKRYEVEFLKQKLQNRVSHSDPGVTDYINNTPSSPQGDLFSNDDFMV